MSHDTAGADSHVVSDGHAGQDYRSAADPNAVTDFYRRRLRAAKSKFSLFTRQGEPFPKIQRVKRRVDLNRRTNERIIADFDAVVIKKNAVHVDFAMISEKNIFPVVAKKKEP